MDRRGLHCKAEFLVDSRLRVIAMDKLVCCLVMLLLLGFVSCQYDQGRGLQHGNQPPANILLHKQALGQDGSFNYAFAADNGLRQGEVINPDGSRKGSYSYVDPNGKTVSLSYTAGKDGFRVLNGDHLPRAPEQQQQQQQRQYYQQQPQNPQYPQGPHLSSNYPLFRPNPIPFETYRNAPDVPAYRGNPISYEDAHRQTHHQFSPQAHPSQYRRSGHYEPPYRQVPHQFRAAPQYRQYSVQEGNHERPSPYVGQQFRDEYQQEDSRKPHSFGNGYSFEFAG